MGKQQEIPKDHDGQTFKFDFKKIESAVNFSNERASFKSFMDISKLQEALSKKASFHITHYELGQAEKTDANVKKMRQLKPAVLVGSVDSTRFAQKWHNAAWYKPYLKAASQLSECEQLLDKSTKKWLKEIRPAFDAFLRMADYTGSDRTLKGKYHKDIWELVQKNGSDIVYGKKGILNFLLAFRRITNVRPKIGDSVEQIKLRLGDGVGKKKGAMDRYTYLIVKKEYGAGGGAGAAPKPKAKQKPKPKVAPKAAPKVAPKPVAKTPEKGLQFGSAEFYKKYEISKPDNFKKDLARIEEEWTKDDKMKYLQSKDFWTNKPGETDGQMDARFSRLFASKRSGIRKLYIDLTRFTKYEKWLAEADDDVSRKYKLLYFWVAKRMVEYTQKYEVDLGVLKDKSVNFHKKIMLLESLLKGKGDKTVLVQLIDSSEYLMNNDDEEADRAKWKKLNSKYKKLLLKK